MTTIFKDKGVAVGRGIAYEDMIYGVGFAYSLLARELSSILQPFNLSLTKLNILMVVRHLGQDKGISQEDIGKKLIVTASNMSRRVDELEKEGLVTREALEGNRRIKLIRITPKGSSLLDKLWPDYLKKLEELSNVLPAPEQQVLGGLLTKWVDALSQKREI